MKIYDKWIGIVAWIASAAAVLLLVSAIAVLLVSAGTRAIGDPPAEDILCPDVAYIGADATSLDIRNVKCEKLLDAALWGVGGITVRWEDGPEGCAPVGGMDILVGDEIFRLWWCSLPNGIEFDWRNIERGDCNE